MIALPIYEPVFPFTMKIIGEQIGPSLVHLNFNGCWGRGVMFQYILPIEPMLQKVVHVFYTNKKWIEPLAKISLWGKVNLFVPFHKTGDILGSHFRRGKHA